MPPSSRLSFASLLALIVGCFVFYPLFFRAEPLVRDDLQLIAPLESLRGIQDYAHAWTEGKIFDVAPVRDLSYLMDLRSGAALQRPTFHLTNFLLWVLWVTLAFAVFRSAVPDAPRIWPLAILLIALHPIYVIDVAWISGRKHLLAGIFCLGITWLLLQPSRESLRNRILLVTGYLLSVFSHPLLLGWPLWALVYLKGEGRSSRECAKILLPLFVLMIAIVGINAWYYNALYPVVTGGVTKFSDSLDAGPGIALMSIGRALFNLLLPFRLSPVDYYPGSWEGMTGLVLLPLFFWLTWKNLPRKKSIVWGLFFVFPLLTINAKSTRVFLCDTYLLVPSVGIWILAGELASKATEKIRIPSWGRTASVILIVAIAGSAVLEDRRIAASFASIESLFSLAYAREATPQVKYVHAVHLFERGDFRESAKISIGLLGAIPEADTLFAQTISTDSEIPLETKIRLLREHESRQPFYHYFLARNLAKNGDFAEAFAELRPQLSHLSNFHKDAPGVAAEALWMSEKAGAANPELAASIERQLPEEKDRRKFRAVRDKLLALPKKNSQ